MDRQPGRQAASTFGASNTMPVAKMKMAIANRKEIMIAGLIKLFVRNISGYQEQCNLPVPPNVIVISPRQSRCTTSNEQ